MRFARLTILEWKQFQALDIEFHPNLTVLTGANSSGKTTILNLLSRHFGWSHHELSTPAKDEATGTFKFFTRFFKRPWTRDDSKIGELQYSNEVSTAIEVPDSDAPQYQLTIRDLQQVNGLAIPSHRPEYIYQQISQISTQKRGKKQAFDLVSNNLRSLALGSGGKPSNHFVKDMLLTWAIYGYGNEAIQADPEQLEYYEGFQRTLRKVLPHSLGFRKFVIRNSEILLITDSGDFMLDAVSGGISALIDLSWQVYMFQTKESAEFTVLIDEVENHLHASMQRKVLPDFLGAFPNVQFIVSTHSPLIVGSVKDSNVFALRYNEENRIYSERLDLVRKAKGAAEVLREVLGVPFTMPIWVEDELNEVVQRYSEEELTSAQLMSMRQELSLMGLHELIPEAIIDVFDKLNDQAQ